jgi:hypothetical protein
MNTLTWEKRVMHIRYISFLVFITVLLNPVFGQNGYIRGTVFEQQTGETLPGVSILVENTTLGTISDFDGKFNIEIPAGVYDLRLSYISYQTLNITEVKVDEGEVTILDNLILFDDNIELEGVEITAEAFRNTETAMVTMKRKSATLLDGISAAGFRKTGDSDAASTIKRVPGVSVEGGRYVFVRGLGDRYTKTILNGVDIPGLDPDRNTLQMDIFPTGVIDNIVVNKSFSAHLSADFTGGVIDITTKDFPEENKASISFSFGINPAMHFNPDYLTYEGGKTDWLGFDDGTRSIPASDNIPLITEVIGNPEGPEGQRYREILESFNPTLAAMKQKSFMDFSLGLTHGNQIVKNTRTWGYNFSLAYKSDTEFYEDAEYGRYGIASDPDVYEMDQREFTFGDYSANNILIAGLAGLAMKTKQSKYIINLLHLQNGESKAGVFDYIGSDKGSVFTAFQHNLEYSQRSLTNLLLSGKHFLGQSKWEVEWKISPTLSELEDPDIRFTRYETRGESYSIGTETGFPERIWRELDEMNLVGQLNIAKDFQLYGSDVKILFGGSYILKDRNYEIRSFALNIRNLPLTGNPNELMWPENLWPYYGSVSRGTTYDAPFTPTNPNQFNANSQNMAAYLSAEFKFLSRVRAIFGVRSEKFTQFYTGQDQLGNNVLDNTEVLNNIDLFPSVNLIYSINDKQNLRISYTKTIARPSFKELSYAEIFDPITGRVFVGGFFTDANNETGIVYWDGQLQSTNISNLDVRWELYHALGQTISVSGFYKAFEKPIEIIQFVTQNSSFQPRNVGDGTVWGLELEMRQNLGLLSQNPGKFTLVSNFTLARSRIKLSETEMESRLNFARIGENIGEYRDMAGQAPYLINAGVSYNGGERGLGKKLEAGLYYNVQGQTLMFVGIVDRPSVYSKPFHSLNFNANKSFGEYNKMTIGLRVDNLLNSTKEAVFKSYGATDTYFNRIGQGTKITLRFSYNLL